MTYTKADFRILKDKLNQSLVAQNGEPLSCELYGVSFAHGALSIESEQGDVHEIHVAEACNIAAVISSIGRILSLPRSDIACEEMSEVLLLRLDVLREYIRATIETALKSYAETDDDKMVRRWAGFLKHPYEYVFAHRCLSSSGAIFDPPAIEIDCAFLTAWDKITPKERDKRKADLANQIVSVKLPSVAKIAAFFDSSANHINKLIAANTLQGVSP